MGSAWKFAAVFLGGILFAFSSRMVDPFLSSRPTVLVNKEEFGLVPPQPLTALTPAEMMAEMMAKENRKLRDQLESQQAELAVLRKGSVPRKVFHFLKEAGYGIGNMQSPQFFKDIDEQRGLLVVDVGACDGSDWAVPAATDRGHTVLAFEPIPANRDRFMQTVRGKGIEDRTVLVDPTSSSIPTSWPLDGTGRIFLFAACVSNFTGKVKMFSQSELASLIPQDFYSPLGGIESAKETNEIPAIRLDSIISGQNIHLLKIDTQGHELGVLKGAQRLFEEHRINMVELEFWPKGMAVGGVNAVEVLDFLHGHGFLCFDFSKNRHIPGNRPSDFEGFVASFDGSRDNGFGAWDELICYHVGGK